MRHLFTIRNTIALVLAVAAIIMLGIFSQIENWKRDLTTNHAQLQRDATDPLLRPPRLQQSPLEVAETIQRWVDGQSNWSLLGREQNDSGIVLHLTRHTKLMRFTDDIHVRIRSGGDTTQVDAESQSRVGKGDLGQNRRNLKELVSVLVEDR